MEGEDTIPSNFFVIEKFAESLVNTSTLTSSKEDFVITPRRDRCRHILAQILLVREEHEDKNDAVVLQMVQRDMSDSKAHDIMPMLAIEQIRKDWNIGPSLLKNISLISLGNKRIHIEWSTERVNLFIQ